MIIRPMDNKPRTQWGLGFGPKTSFSYIPWNLWTSKGLEMQLFGQLELQSFSNDVQDLKYNEIQ